MFHEKSWAEQCSCPQWSSSVRFSLHDKLDLEFKWKKKKRQKQLCLIPRTTFNKKRCCFNTKSVLMGTNLPRNWSSYTIVVYQLELAGTNLVYNGCIPDWFDGHQLTNSNLVSNGCIPARVDGNQLSIQWLCISSCWWARTYQLRIQWLYTSLSWWAPAYQLSIEWLQGSRYRSPLSPNAKKKYFWHKKIWFVENKWRKKILTIKKSPPKYHPSINCSALNTC